MAKTKATEPSNKTGETAPPKKVSRNPDKATETIKVAEIFKKPVQKVKELRVSKRSQEAATKAKQNPLYREITKVNEDYRKAASSVSARGLQDVYEELVRRIEEKDVNGEPISVTGVPTEADIEALREDEKNLARPLSEDVLDIKSREEDGTTSIAKVKLGDTIQELVQTSERRAARTTPLIAELAEIDAEIKLLLDQIGNDKATRKANSEFKAKMDSFRKAFEEAGKQTEKDVKKAREDDYQAGKLRQEKWESFLAEMGA